MPGLPADLWIEPPKVFISAWLKKYNGVVVNRPALFLHPLVDSYACPCALSSFHVRRSETRPDGAVEHGAEA